MLGKLLPANLFATLRDDFQTLYAYSQAKTVAKLTNEEANRMHSALFAQTLQAAEDYGALEQKTYQAAHRVFGAFAMVAGTLLAAKIILPIITFKFCLGMGLAVGAFITGSDIFKMATNREGLSRTAVPNSTGCRDFLWNNYSEAALEQLTNGTLLGSMWRTIAPPVINPRQ